jgi:hypothetical protein
MALGHVRVFCMSDNLGGLSKDITMKKMGAITDFHQSSGWLSPGVFRQISGLYGDRNGYKCRLNDLDIARESQLQRYYLCLIFRSSGAVSIYGGNRPSSR